MARAKRTQRAEARRRYRAANALDEPIEFDDDTVPATSSGRSTTTGAPKPAATSARMSIGTAFRTSFRPLNVREDLASLPWIATHTPALWVPLLVTIGSAVAHGRRGIERVRRQHPLHLSS